MFKKIVTATVATLTLTAGILTVTESAQAGFGKALAELAVSIRPELRFY